MSDRYGDVYDPEPPDRPTWQELGEPKPAPLWDGDQQTAPDGPDDEGDEMRNLPAGTVDRLQAAREQTLADRRLK